MQPLHKRSAILVIAVLVTASLSGCNDGYTNTNGADLRAFGAQPLTLDPDSPPFNQSARPLARFPSVIAVVRVQGQNYRHPGVRSYASGGYTIVATRDVETDDQFKSLASHPMIRALVPLNHLALPSSISGSRDLCDAARRVGADLLLIYTLDTSSVVVHHVPELSVVTLGLMPEGQSQVRCTASAVLLDARSGFTYALSEGSGEQNRLTSAWGSDSATGKAAEAAEQRAFHQLLQNLATRWDEVVNEYAMK